jgi:hypothetical protein
MFRQKLRLALRMGAAGVVLAILAVPVRAELALRVYREMQKKAPEFLQIKVTGVKTETTKKEALTIVHVAVEAKVVKVERSETGLKKGDAIRIVYIRTIRKRPIIGPSQVPLVTKGEEYPAFLKRRDGKTYAPAAGGKTFRVMPAEGKKKGN